MFEKDPNQVVRTCFPMDGQFDGKGLYCLFQFDRDGDGGVEGLTGKQNTNNPICYEPIHGCQ